MSLSRDIILSFRRIAGQSHAENISPSAEDGIFNAPTFERSVL